MCARAVLRAAVRCLVVMWAAAMLLFSQASPVHATSPARITAVAAMLRHTAPGLYTSGAHPDLVSVTESLQSAGVQVWGDLYQACLPHPIDVSAPRPAGPAPADLFFYTAMARARDPAGGVRVGMFIDPDTLAIYDGAKPGMITIARDELLGTGSGTARTLYVKPEIFSGDPGYLAPLACRLPPSAWPGGVDDVSIAAGHIALADPTTVAQDIIWSSEHPRNADPHWYDVPAGLLLNGLHALSSLAATLFTTLAGVTGAVMGWGSGVLAGIIDRLPAGFLLVGAVNLVSRFGGWAVGLLGRSFDGSGLFRVLRTVLEMSVLMPFKLAGMGLSATGLPVLGGLGGFMNSAVDAMAGFMVTLATGLSEGRTTFGEVGLALLCDVFFLGKAGIVGRLGSELADLGGHFAPTAVDALRALPARFAASRFASMARASGLSDQALRMSQGAARFGVGSMRAGAEIGKLTMLRPSALYAAAGRAARARAATADVVRAAVSHVGPLSHLMESPQARGVAEAAVAPTSPVIPRAIPLGALDFASNLTTRTSETITDTLSYLADGSRGIEQRQLLGYSAEQGWLRSLIGRVPAKPLSRFVQTFTGHVAKDAPASLRAGATAFEYANEGAHLHFGASVVFNFVGGNGLPTIPAPEVKAPASVDSLVAAVRAARTTRTAAAP